MPSRPSRLRYKLEWLGLSLAARIVPVFPRSFCLFLAGSFGMLASILDRHGRKVALENLEVAFGRDLTERQRRRIMRKSFQYFAQTMIDLLWSPRLTPETFRRYIELENFAETESDTGPERSII